MKLVYIIVHNIINLAKKNKLTLSLVILSTMVSTFGILFYSGYISKNYYDMCSKEGKKIDISLKDEASKQQVHGLIEKFLDKKNKPIKIQAFNFDQNSQENSTIIKVVSNQEESDVNVSIMGEFSLNYGKELLVGRGLKLREKEPVALIADDLVSYVNYDITPLNYLWKVDRKEFKLVGILSSLRSGEVVVPIDYYIEHYPVNYLRFYYAQALSKEIREGLENVLIQSKVVKEYQFSKIDFALFSFDFWIEFIQILVIFVIIIINIFVLVYFLMNRMKRCYKIYSICGGSSSRVYKIIVLQTFLLILLGILAGIIIYFGFLPIFSRYGLVYDEKLSLYIELATGIAIIEFLFSAVIGRIVHSSLDIYQIAE